VRLLFKQVPFLWRHLAVFFRNLTSFFFAARQCNLSHPFVDRLRTVETSGPRALCLLSALRLNFVAFFPFPGLQGYPCNFLKLRRLTVGKPLALTSPEAFRDGHGRWSPYLFVRTKVSLLARNVPLGRNRTPPDVKSGVPFLPRLSHLKFSQGDAEERFFFFSEQITFVDIDPVRICLNFLVPIKAQTPPVPPTAYLGFSWHREGPRNTRTPCPFHHFYSILLFDNNVICLLLGPHDHRPPRSQLFPLSWLPSAAVLAPPKLGLLFSLSEGRYRVSFHSSLSGFFFHDLLPAFSIIFFFNPCFCSDRFLPFQPLVTPDRLLLFSSK